MHGDDLLESRGLRVRRLDLSERQEAEAALTCLSLLYSVSPQERRSAFDSTASTTHTCLGSSTGCRWPVAPPAVVPTASLIPDAPLPFYQSIVV